jgi:hypothetical protein
MRGYFRDEESDEGRDFLKGKAGSMPSDAEGQGDIPGVREYPPSPLWSALEILCSLTQLILRILSWSDKRPGAGAEG